MANVDVVYAFERTYPCVRVGDQDRLIDWRMVPRRQAGTARTFIKENYGGLDYLNPNWLFDVTIQQQIDKDTVEDFMEWATNQFRMLEFKDISSTVYADTYTRADSDEWGEYKKAEDRGVLFICNTDEDVQIELNQTTAEWSWSADGTTFTPFTGNAIPTSPSFNGENIKFPIAKASYPNLNTSQYIQAGMWGVIYEDASAGSLTDDLIQYLLDPNNRPHKTEAVRVNAVDYDQSTYIYVTVDKIGFSRSARIDTSPTGCIYLGIPAQSFGHARFEGWNMPEVGAQLSGAFKKVTFNFLTSDEPFNIVNANTD